MRNTPSATDPDRHFRTEHLQTDLKGRSVRGGAITMFAQVGKFILQTCSTIVLARLLTPQDYGLVGMVTAVTGFINLFKDMGLSMATVQRAEINHRQVSTLFWINVAVSLGLTVVTVALSPAIAWFYGEPRLTWITLVLASGYIFGGLAVQHQALLNRQMRFASLAIVDTIALSLGLGSAIISAWYGAGYWALVVMQLAIGIAYTIGVWVVCRWRPGLPVKHAGIRSMLAFGSNLTGFHILHYFSRNLDNVLIGFYAGAQQLGLYLKAYQLLMLPIQQISMPMTYVAIPTLSRLQHEPEKYRAYYCKGVLFIVTLGMPLVTFLFVVADKLILALLGPQWIDTVTLFRVLAPAAFLGTFNVATGWVYISLGRTARQLRWEIFSSTVMLLGFMIGVRWGALGVAASFSITSLLVRYPAYVYCFQSTPLRVSHLINVLWRPALASLAAGATLFAVHAFFSFSSNILIWLPIYSSIYAMLYISFWVVLPQGRESIYEMLTTVKTLWQKSKSSNEHGA